MKSLICVLLLTAVFIFGNAQEYKVKWSPVQKVPTTVAFKYGKYIGFDLLDINENNYYLYMDSEKSNPVYTYDHNHKLISKKNTNTQFNNVPITLYNSIRTSSGLFRVFGYVDKKMNISKFLISKIEDGKFSPIKVAYSFEDIKNPNFSTYLFGLRNSYFDYAVSDNGKFVITIRSLFRGDKEENSQLLSIVVYDENLQVVWDKVQEFPDENKQINDFRCDVSNSGEGIVIATLKIDKEYRALYGNASNYKIFVISKDKTNEYDLKLDADKLLTRLSIYKSDKEENEFKLVGFYASKESKSTIGLYYASLNLITGEIQFKNYPFQKEFLEKIGKKETLSDNYYIEELHTFDDGSFSLIAQEDSYGSNSLYFSKGLIIARFSSEGNLMNIEYIDKSISNFNGPYTGFASFYLNDKIYLIFNTTKNAIQRKELGETYSSGVKTVYTDLAIIGNDGLLEHQQVLFKEKDLGGFYFTPDTYGNTLEKLLIFAVEKNAFKVGTIELK